MSLSAAWRAALDGLIHDAKPYKDQCVRSAEIAQDQNPKRRVGIRHARTRLRAVADLYADRDFRNSFCHRHPPVNVVSNSKSGQIPAGFWPGAYGNRRLRRPDWPDSGRNILSPCGPYFATSDTQASRAK